MVSQLFHAEPVAVLAFIRALIALAVVLGLGLPVGLDIALLAVIETGFALLTRSRVSPAA